MYAYVNKKSAIDGDANRIKFVSISIFATLDLKLVGCPSFLIPWFAFNLLPGCTEKLHKYLSLNIICPRRWQAPIPPPLHHHRNGVNNRSRSFGAIWLRIPISARRSALGLRRGGPKQRWVTAHLLPCVDKLEASLKRKWIK